MDFKDKGLVIVPITSQEIPDNKVIELDKWINTKKFNGYYYSILPSVYECNLYLLNGFSSEWHEVYWKSGYYRFDPVMSKIGLGLSPVRWENEPAGKSDCFSTMAKYYGVNNVHAIASPFGERTSLLVIISSEYNHNLNDDDYRLLIGNMSVYLRELNQQMLLNSPHFCKKKQKISLTHRELECLTWISQGKTTWEVSKILSISERTIIFHLENCSKKLCTVNRVQAVHQATRLGFI